MNNKIIKKRVAQAWGIFMLASLLFTSCLKNQEDFFDDSASTRMTNTINKTKEILRNSEYGWEFEYYPDRDLSYGGLVYTVKFDSLDATIACSLIPDSTVTSYYRVTNDNGPVLTFDTYNPLMHYFATPSAGEYEAKDGDFEFVIEKLGDDEIASIFSISALLRSMAFFAAFSTRSEKICLVTLNFLASSPILSMVIVLILSPCLIELTTSWPSTTFPNTACLSLSHGVFTCVMKNWLPLVPGPAFAMLRTPGPS